VPPRGLSEARVVDAGCISSRRRPCRLHSHRARLGFKAPNAGAPIHLIRRWVGRPQRCIAEFFRTRTMIHERRLDLFETPPPFDFGIAGPHRYPIAHSQLVIFCDATGEGARLAAYGRTRVEIYTLPGQYPSAPLGFLRPPALRLSAPSPS